MLWRAVLYYHHSEGDARGNCEDFSAGCRPFFYLLGINGDMQG